MYVVLLLNGLPKYVTLLNAYNHPSDLEVEEKVIRLRELQATTTKEKKKESDTYV